MSHRRPNIGVGRRAAVVLVAAGGIASIIATGGGGGGPFITFRQLPVIDSTGPN
jgi:hypothetical protein